MPILGAVASQNYPRIFNYITRNDSSIMNSLVSLSDDTFLTVGQGYITNARKYVLSKYNKNGTVAWQKSLDAGSGRDVVAYAMATDSSNNIYSAGDFYNASSQVQALLTKHDSSGTLLWQKTFTGLQTRFQGVAVDSSSNVYVTGMILNAGQDILVAKYNSSGVLQWKRRLSQSEDDNGNGIFVDSSGNCYIAARGQFGSPILVKYNTSGTLQWQIRLTNFFGSYNAVQVNSSGDIFVGGYHANGQWLLVKYNSSGVQQWVRGLNSSGFDFIANIKLDSSGNIYATGSSAYVDNADIQLAKYDSSGTLQWQRRVKSQYNQFADRGRGIDFDLSGNLRISGYFNYVGSERSIVMQIPSDGSKTGTYVLSGADITYEASSMTVETPTYTSEASTLTQTDPDNITDATPTLTAADTSFTNYIVYI
jgi:hypothetical protein